MRILRLTGLVLVALVLVLSGLVYQLGIGLERTALSPAFYRDLMGHTGLIEVIHARLEEAVPELMVQRMQPEMGQEAPKEVLAAYQEGLSLMMGALVRTFDAGWLEKQLMLVIEDILAFIEGNREELGTVIDLKRGKELLESQLAAALKELSPEKLRALEMHPELVESTAGQLIAAIPDQLQLGELVGDAGLPPETHEILAKVRMVRGYFAWVPYVTFACLFLFCCLLAGIPGGLRWSGGATVVAGAAFITGLLVARDRVAHGFVDRLGEPALVDPGLVTAVLGFVVSRLVRVSLVFVSVGVVLVAASYFFRVKAAAKKRRGVAKPASS
ncbi:MAG: hypothetical protein AB1445_00235 [Bacillota bacterium]